MTRLESDYQSFFYGYCNGDLLFHSSFIPTLYTLSQKVRSGELLSKVYLMNLTSLIDFLCGSKSEL